MKTIKLFLFLLICILTSCNSDEVQTSNDQLSDKSIAVKSKFCTISHQSGAYKNPFYLKIIPSNSKQRVIYTLDGSNPSLVNGKQFVDSLFIDDNTKLTPIISYKSTTLSTYEEYKSWTPPKVKPIQATVVKFIIIENDKILDNIITNTYWVGINPTKNKLSLINITIDTTDLFDYETGIFVPGIHVDSSDIEWSGNYHMRGKNWEKNAHIEYFDKNLTKLIDQSIGLRIHGLRTPIAPQKSLRVYAREHKFENLFFKDRKYKTLSRFIIRTPFSCWGSALLNDILVAELTKDINVDNMQYQPSVLYINGEYWGLYNIRERTDEKYLANLYKVDDDSVYIIRDRTHIKEGNLSEFNPLWEIIENDTMVSEKSYKKFIELFDIDEFIDYYAAQIYFSNYDWPGNNMNFWKPYHSGKWRHLFYDLDATLGDPKKNNMIHATKAGVNKFPFNDNASLFFRSLLRNKTFKQNFINRYTYLMENNFSPENSIKALDKLTKIYAPFIQDQCDRWGQPQSYKEWEDAINKLKIFLEERPKYAKKHLEEYFK